MTTKIILAAVRYSTCQFVHGGREFKQRESFNKRTAKLQALVYDILTCSTMEEGAGKWSLDCANEFDQYERTNEWFIELGRLTMSKGGGGGGGEKEEEGRVGGGGNLCA